MAIIENINVSNPNDGLGDSLRNSQVKANNNFAELNDKKVEKIAGKDLSENDFTDTLKDKLDSLEVGAEVQLQSDWQQTDILAKDFIKNKPELSQYFTAVGGFDYEDLTTATTPLTYTTGYLQLTNDTLGANTQTNLNPYGVDSVWDELTNTFNFGSLSIGDEVLLRIHLKLTTSAANQISGLSLLFGEGTASEYSLPIDLQIYHKTAGDHDVTKEVTFYLGNEDWRITPVKLRFNSDANATVKIYGWHPYIIRKSVNILDVNDDNYKTFQIANIEPNNDDTTVDIGKISIGYNSVSNRINSILFDSEYSKYLVNYNALVSVYDFSLNFFDKTNNKSYVSFISSFTSVGARFRITLEETIFHTDFNINDKVEIFINANKSSAVVSQNLQQVTDIGNTSSNILELITDRGTFGYNIALKGATLSDQTGIFLWLTPSFLSGALVAVPVNIYGYVPRSVTLASEKELYFSAGGMNVGSEKLFIQADGKMGLGTIGMKPLTEKLDIDGGLRVRGLTDSSGDVSYSKILKAKANGTIGWEDNLSSSGNISVAIPFNQNYEYTTNIVGNSFLSSDIDVNWGVVTDFDENTKELCYIDFLVTPKLGSFDLTIFSRDSSHLGGTYKLKYKIN